MVSERRKTIFQRMRKYRLRAEQLFREFGDEYEFKIVEMEVGVAHVHIVISFHAKYSIVQVDRMMKSISARELFRVCARSRRGCGAGSCGWIFVRQNCRTTYDSADCLMFFVKVVLS